MKKMFTFPTAKYVLNPLKKKLMWINFMSFKQIQSILTTYISQLSLGEMLILINMLINVNKKTRRLKNILFISISASFLYFLFFLVKKITKKKDKKKEEK